MPEIRQKIKQFAKQQTTNEMKSILKRRDAGGNNRRRSTSTQPRTTSDSVVEIDVEDACLSTVPWSVQSSSEGRSEVDHPSHVTDGLERRIDADMQRVDEKLGRLERQLDSKFQQYGHRRRSTVVDDSQVHYSTRS